MTLLNDVIKMTNFRSLHQDDKLKWR